MEDNTKLMLGGIVLAVILVLGLAMSDSSADSSNAAPRPKAWQCDGEKCVPVYGVTNAANFGGTLQMFGGDQGRLYNAESYYVSQARPAVDLPEELRKKNWGGGSCVHATTISLLRWIADGSGDPNLYWLAENWPYSGGEYSSRHRERIEQANLRYVMTVDGDVELVKWALATRRGCGVAYNGHCIYAAGYDPNTSEVILCDNNHTSEYISKNFDSWCREWQNGGGWAFAFVYDPPTPTPTSFNLASWPRVRERETVEPFPKKESKPCVSRPCYNPCDQGGVRRFLGRRR